MNVSLHIGFDDTDSIAGGCTTYIAALLVEFLGAETFLDYPNLIRLNPNVPWKTRGNAALSLRVSIDEQHINDVIEQVIDTVEDHSQLDCPRTDPGIVFLVGPVPHELTVFARRTIQDIVSKKEAFDLIRHFGLEAVGFKGSRGIIGALAAVGETLPCDHTYELIAYRTLDNRGKPRKVDLNSVFKMDKETSGLTFNNVDYEKKRVLLTPRGPDPILLGVRGETPNTVKNAYHMIDVNETVERWVIFRTNQGTDAHLRKVDKVAQIRPYRPVVATGSVVVAPYNIPGRHVIFVLGDDSGQIDCAAYEPTGKFKGVVKELIVGDSVEVYGGVRRRSERNPQTINIEKLRATVLTPLTVLRNPVCCVCGKRMGSMGRGKGFRCKRCGMRVHDVGKVQSELKRGIGEELYIPPPRANRHLTKPRCRYGIEKTTYEIHIPKDFWGYDGALGADHNCTNSLRFG